jgi:glutamate synthase (NADPH/NADH) large chain
MRVCHLDTCPVGIATQNPVLRERFTGKPEFVENFFWFLAEQVREQLAALGLRSLDDAIGRADLLDLAPATDHWKAHGLDLSPVLAVPTSPYGDAPRRVRGQDHQLEKALDNELLAQAEPALANGTPVKIAIAVRNEHRSVGAMLGGEVVRRLVSRAGHKRPAVGLPDGTIDVTLHGTAGQSFGAFVPGGVTLRLFGDANDYVGKGLSGGRIIVRPDENSTFTAEDQIIAGNTLLYGATAGEAYLRGRVGQRFAVRNSGAVAVVEGVGDHGCEYMTGGTVVVLGPTGRNFAAGMSGGTAYLWNLDPILVNRELVELSALNEAEAEELFELVERHFQETGSAVAEKLLADWPASVAEFTAVVPREYKQAIEAMRAAEAAGRDVNAAVMTAMSGAAAQTPTEKTQEVAHA